MTTDEPRDDVSLGEVSDEVREELARLFGEGGPEHMAEHMAEHVAEQTAEPSRDTDDTVETDGWGRTADEESRTADDMDVAESTDVVATADSARIDDTPGARIVVPIGDPSTDTVAPLPIDPLVAATAVSPGSGVVQIVDDGTLPVVRDARDVSRVLIVDDDSPAPRTPDRDRRKRRSTGIGRVKWLRVGAITTVVFIVVAAVLASPIFAIRTVVFDGAVYTADETVTAVRDLLEGSSVFTADTELARQTMLEDPWVAEVRITTDFPGRAVVEVAEREPVVWYAGEDQKARVIDARGHVIAVLEGWPTKYLQVRGTGPSLDPGATADDAYRAAAQLVLALPDEIGDKVEALDLSAGGELSMFLDGGTIVRFGPPEGLQDKLVAVVVLMRRQDPSTLAVVDVSTGEPTVQTR